MNPIDKLSNISSIEQDVIENKKGTATKKKKALRDSINEGAAANVSLSLSDHFIIPIALALKSSPFQIGILSSLSGLINPIAQMYGAKLIQKQTRKKLVTKYLLLQTILLLPIALLGILMLNSILVPILPSILIILFVSITFARGLVHPAWFSWMGDIIPEKDRGRYLSIRNKVLGITGLAGILIGALILDRFETKGLALIGFSIIFLLASIFRYISYTMIKKQYSPQIKINKKEKISFIQFIKQNDNYKKFSIFMLVFHFSLMLASPFFAVYMLEELNFSYVTFTFVAFSSIVFYLLFTPLAGKFSDRYGNKKLLSIGTFFFVLSPIFWILIKSPLLLVIVPQLFAGIANAAFVISTTNFIYDSTSKEKRADYVAYTSFLAGLGTFAGSLLGGYLITPLEISPINPYLTLFGIAAFLRLLTYLIFIPHIKEVKKVHKLPPLHFNPFHPFKSISSDIGFLKTISK